MAKKKPAAQASKNPDDLKKIEGIGPKIEELLFQQGIDSFSKLARTTLKRLQDILDEAGPQFSAHDPATWKQQSALAEKGQWDELKALQKKLFGGRAYAPTAQQIPEQTTTVVFSAIGGGNYEPGKPFVIERLLTPQEVAQEYALRKDMLEPELERGRDAAMELWELLQQRPDASTFTGIAARFRTKFGHPVSPLQVVIAINVETKLPLQKLSEREIAPIDPWFQGFRVKITEGQFELLAGGATGFLLGGSTPKQALPFTDSVTGGVPISAPAQSNNFGTLGVVSVSGTEGIGITAAHVCGNGIQVDQISDTGTTRMVGAIRKLLPPPFNTSVESVDAACFDLKASNGQPPVVLPPVGQWARGLSHPFNQAPSATPAKKILYSKRRVKQADGKLTLVKFGNGSGEVINGRIKDTNYGVVKIGGKFYFNNFTVEPENRNGRFATPGDSGSLLAIQANIGGEEVLVAVGILFAALENTPSIGLACNISEVIEALDLGVTLSSYLVDF